MIDGVLDAIEKANHLAGPLGVIALIFIVALLFFLRIIGKYALEATTARNEVMAIQNQMATQLKNLLEECERTCREKDSSIILKDILIENLRKKLLEFEIKEQNLHHEISKLRVRVRQLEKRS